MTDCVREYSLTHEELTHLAQLLLDALQYSAQTVTVEEVRVIDVQCLEEIVRVIDLDRMCGTVHGLADPVGQLMSWLAEKFSWLTDTLESIFSGLLESARKALEDVIRAVSSGITWLIEQLWSWLETAFETVTTGLDALRNAITSSVETLLSTLQGFIDNVMQGLATLGEALRGFASSIMDALSNIASTVSKVFADLSNMIASALQSLGAQIVSALQSAFTTVMSTIQQVGSTILSAFETVADYVMKLPDVIMQGITTLWNWIQQGFATVSSAVTTAFETVKNFFAQVGQQVVSAFQQVQRAFQLVANALTGFVNAILKFPEWFPRWFYDNIAKPIVEGFKTLAKWLWQLAPDWFREALSRIHEFFTSAWDFLTKTLPDFFSKLYEGLVEFTKDPATWLRKYIVEPLWDTALQLKDAFWSALTTLGHWLWSALQGIISALKGVFETTVEALKALSTWFYTLFVKPMISTVTSAVAEVSKRLAELYAGVRELAGELMEAYEMITGIMTSALPLEAVTALAEGLASASGDQEVSIRPLGLGVVLRVKLGHLFKALAKFARTAVKDLTKTFCEGIAVASSFWIFEGLRYRVASIFRNVLPFEIPTITEGREMVQRFMPHKNFTEIFNKYREWLAMRGYSDLIIDLFASPAEKYYIEVRDRFWKEGKPARRLPLSLIYNIPTASEMCRMMVRDIFYSLDDFKKAIAMHGYVEDIAYMYYLLHFKYPSPEKLWDFLCRSIACMLWFEPTREMIESAKAEAEKIGAFAPKGPVELNAVNPEIARKVFTAFSTYMKWHDYAKFAWIDGFTSDNWLVIDTLADIPGKIDVRWMLKWGIFEKLRDAGVKVTSTIREIRDAFFKGGEETAISLDLRVHSKLLQATGLHPDWVPIVAVAEAMNMLTEERTLLRTGFINLFKEGFWTLKTIEELLAGFFEASFHVAYFDIKDMQWKEKWVKLPVMFLPAERKLLELRALMDRALDILRDFTREVNYAYAEHIITDDKEYEEKVKTAIGKVNAFFKELMRAISGKERVLEYDEAYWSAYREVVKLARDIYTYRRIRYWVHRAIGWILYRIARAEVTTEDLEKVVKVLAEEARMSDREKEALKKVAEVIHGIAVREYVPTPYMFATIVEYVPQATALFQKVMEARNVPEEWRRIWLLYTYSRVLRDDFMYMLTRAIFNYSYGIISTKQLHAILEQARNVGFDATEIALRLEGAKLYRLQRIFTHLIPSPIGLTGYARYTDIADTLCMLRVEQLLEGGLIPRELADLIRNFYRKLIINRSVYPDLRGYIYDLIRAYEYGVLDDAGLRRELENLKQYGLRNENIDLIMRRARLRRQIRQAMYGPRP